MDGWMEGKWIEMGKSEGKPESYHLSVTRVGTPAIVLV